MDEKALAVLVSALTATGVTVASELAKRVTGDVYVAVKRNLTTVANKAKAMLQNRAAQPDEPDEPPLPPGRILGLVAAAARFEDDDEMQTRYAALLANAAIPNGPIKVLPGFVEILRQLVPAHVAILDALHTAYVMAPEMRVAQRPDLTKQSGLSFDDYTLIVQDLDRLKLIDAVRAIGDKTDPTERWKYNSIYVTDLGLAFILACTPPRRG